MTEMILQTDSFLSSGGLWQSNVKSQCCHSVCITSARQNLAAERHIAYWLQGQFVNVTTWLW